MLNRGNQTRANGEDVYSRLKAAVISFEFIPGQHLKIQDLARSFGDKTSRVAEALGDLASEDLIVHLPNKGFFMREPSVASTASDYRFNRDLLKNALTHAIANGIEYDSAVASEFLRMPERTAGTPGDLALELTRLAADFFARVASLYDVPRASTDIAWLNDRLHFVRLLTFELKPDIASELSELISLFVAKKYEALIGSIKVYHDDRMEDLPAILERGFGRSFRASRHGALLNTELAELTSGT